MRILGISGSLRRDSYNTKLLREAGRLLPPGAELVEFDGLKAVAPYDADDEASARSRRAACSSCARRSRRRTRS